MHYLLQKVKNDQFNMYLLMLIQTSILNN